MAQYFYRFSGVPGELPLGFYLRDAESEHTYRYKASHAGLQVGYGESFSFNSLRASGLTAADVDVVMKFRINVFGDDSSYKGVGLYLRAAPDSASDAYIFTHPGDGGRQLIARKGTTELDSNTAAFPDKILRDWYMMRAQAIGTTIRAKVWRADSAEPTSWDVSATDSAFSQGAIGVCCIDDSGVLSDVEHLAIGTDGDMAPSSPVIGLSGSVLDDSGSPAARQLAAIAGRRVVVATTESDPSTGAFILPVSLNEPHAVIAFDEEAGDENALIYDRLMPEPLA